MSTGPVQRITVGAYFDGERLHERGPYVFVLDGGCIAAIAPGQEQDPIDAPFLMPRLVDAHVHVFLDGRILEGEARKLHLLKDRDSLLATARENAAAAWEAGVALLRDAGDPHGINNALRGWLASDLPGLRLRSSSAALHRPGRYGSFFGRAAAHDGDLLQAVRELAEHADQIKVVLTGPIDFATGAVKGPPQFDGAAARAIVEAARERGKTAFVHCNGIEGLEVAITARFDSIEHGYGIDEESLRRMAGEGIAWTPTLAPVAALRNLAPGVTGFSSNTLARLDIILARHAEAIARAAELGVTLLCGSDAGSQGVPHGSGLVDEMILMAASGAPMEAVLRAATEAPRERWGEPPAKLVAGNRFAALALTQSPFESPSALRCVNQTSLRNW
jgi:imidazolonepropionase-like amidohydrolase